MEYLSTDAKPSCRGWKMLIVLSAVFVSFASAQQVQKPPTFANRFDPKTTRERVRPSRDQFTAESTKRFAADRILVRFRTNTTPEQRAQSHGVAGVARQVRDVSLVPGLQLVRLNPGTRIADALRIYRANSAVLYAEPDYRVHHFGQPDDPNYPDLWGLNNTGTNGGTVGADIDAIRAWEITTGSDDVVVGITDTGVDFTHSDLAANIWSNTADCNSNGIDDDGNGYVDDCHGIDTYYSDSNPMDDEGHGTHVAGTIGAVGNNSLGVVGVNWKVKIAACKFLGPDGTGYTSGAVACLEYFKALRDRGTNVVATNNSWGSAGYSQALYDAIEAHLQAGILFVTAAGNDALDNDKWPIYPASYPLPNIITVAATTRTDTLAEFSDYGTQTVHLGAPGSEILSTLPNDQYGWGSGTSMATPHVTGVAALLKAQDPSRDWRAIKNLILAGTEPISGLKDTIMGGRLNAYLSMNCGGPDILRRLQPVGTSTTTVSGVPVEIEALHINCANGAGDIMVTIEPGATQVKLVDDGTGSDKEAGDGIYSFQWVPTAAGNYTLTFPDGDVVPISVLNPYTYKTETYNYRSITGSSLNLDAELNQSAWIESPFPVKFGGGSFQKMVVSINGTISFTDNFYDWWWTPLPTPGTATLVAPSWTALWGYPGTPHNVFWDVTGTTPNRELVLEWRDLESACYEPATITFQVVFFENSSDVLFNYKDMIFGVDQYGFDCSPFDNGGGATSGIQVARTVGTQYSYAQPVLTNSKALRWQIGVPVPVLSSMWPFDAVVGDSSLELDLRGKNFLPNSTALWNSSPRTTIFIDSTNLLARVPGGDLTAAGNVPVTVTTPEGGTSNARYLTVYDAYPIPAPSLISPTEVSVGNYDLELKLTGTNFTSKSVVRVNGSERNSFPQNSGLLYAILPASDFKHAGYLDLTVFNPTPGGGSSASSRFTVTNPSPSISQLLPNWRRAGSEAFELLVAGWGLGDSVLRWNGSDRPTTVDNPSSSNTTARAQISAEDLAQPASVKITIFNVPPGGGTSNEVIFEVLAPPVNDDFSQAISFSAVPFSDQRDIRAATLHPSDPVSACSYFGEWNTVWYRFTPAQSQRVSFSMSDNYVGGRILSVWTGQPGSFTEVGCNMNNIFGPEIDAAAGTTYFVMVASREDLSYQLGSAFAFSTLDIAPVPSLDSVTPTATGGGSDLQVTVHGNGFISRSKLIWDNNAEVPTAFVSGTELRAVVPASYATVGSHTVSVLSTEPGGGFSAQLPLKVNSFSLSASPTSVSIGAGTSAAFTVTVNPDQGGFDKQVTFTCAPTAGFTCTFSPATGTPGTAPMSSTLTVSLTTAAVSRTPATVYFGFMLVPLGFCFILTKFRNGKRFYAHLFTLAPVVLAAAPMLSCGGGSDTQTPTTYTVIIHAQSGTLQSTASVSVILQK